MRVRLVLAAVVAVVAFAASTLPASAAGPEGRSGQHGGYVRAPSAAAAAAAPASTCANGFNTGCTPPLTYHGGPVMAQNTVYAIFWAPSGFSYPTGYKTLVEQFFTDVAADSGHADNPYGVTAQYTDSSAHHANYNTTFAGGLDDTDAYPGVLQQCHPADLDGNSESACIWDDSTHQQIHNEVQAFAGAQHLTMDVSHIFVVFFPPHVTSCDDTPMSSCAYTTYCAYHEFGDGTTDPLYANLPYPGDGTYATPCFVASDEPNGNVADLVLSAASHEHIETITDPDGTAWLDSSNSEISDECNFYFGTLQGTGTTKYTNTINGHNYLIQNEYSNAIGGTPVHGCEPRFQLLAAFAPPTGVVAGSSALFDGSGSTDSEGTDTIASYDWDFGDGSAHGSGATPTHQYAASGNYDVVLTVTDALGLVDRVTHSIAVTSVSPAKSATTVTVSGRPNPQTHGRAVRFTVTVRSSGGTPTGSVTLFQNGRTLGTATLSDGTATFKTSKLAVGKHRITASYSGDANFDPSSGAMPKREVIRRP